MKKKSTAHGLHERFMEILNTEKNVWWEKQLGVSNSLIASTWKKGGIPHVDKLIQMCELKGYSANWLLLGIGSKFIETKANGDTEDGRREMQKYIIKLEKQKQEYDKLVQNIAGKKSLIESFVRALSVLGKKDDIALSIEEMQKLDIDEIFEKYLLPWQVFNKSLSDIVFKGIETILKTEQGKKFLITVIMWIQNELDKNIHLERGRLKELESLFASTEFTVLMHDK